MSIWSKKPNIYRLIYSALLLLLTAMACLNFYRNASSPHDENFYQTPPSNFYVSEKINTYKIIHNKNENALKSSSIPPGSYIMAIKGNVPAGMKDLSETLESDNDSIHIKAFNVETWQMEEHISGNRNLDTSKIIYIDGAALIIGLSEGGASDRAGMKRGDLIYRVNGREFKNIFQADSMMRSFESGDIIRYDVLRGNKTIRLDVKLARFGVQFITLTLFISGILYMATGAFLSFKRPKIKAARVTGMAFTLIGFYLAAMYNNAPLAQSEIFSVLRVHLLVITIYIGLVIFLHSYYLFPVERRRILNKKWPLRVLYALGFISVAAVLVILKIDFEHSFTVQFILITLIFVFGISILFIFREKSDKKSRRLGRAIRFSMAANVLFFFFLGAIPYFSGRIGPLLSNIAAYLQIFTLLIPLAYFYTIGKYRLLDLDIRLRRNIQYLVFANAWRLLVTAVVIGLIGLFASIEFQMPNLHFTGSSIEVLNKPLSPYKNLFYEKIFLIIISFLLILVFTGIGKKGLKYLDKKFYRAKFDYRDASSKLLRLMENSLNVENLAKFIVGKLSSLIHLKRAGVIFFKDEGEVRAQVYYGLKTDAVNKYCRLAGPAIVKAVRQFKEVIRVEYMPGDLKEVFLECKFMYIIPVKSKGKILGIILIGEKLSESPYHHEDFEFLKTISVQAAVAVENTMLYESLAQQERMKHELEIARKIQIASLPDSIPEFPGLDISGISLPALEVGGDFYDFLINGREELTVVIGDVSGKGTSAAMYMSKTQGILRTLHDFNLNPREMLHRSNNLLYGHIEKNSFISATAARIDRHRQFMTFSRAGHLPVYHFQKMNNMVIKHKPKGIAMGMTGNSLFINNLEQLSIKFDEGDIFLLITDGVTEARDKSGNEYDERELVNLIIQNNNESAGRLRDSIINSLESFRREEPQYDDITIVVIKVI
ncbi:MAG: SpoIIE family protein phosphatase [Candidatus Kapaibacterium sp.]